MGSSRRGEILWGRRGGVGGGWGRTRCGRDGGGAEPQRRAAAGRRGAARCGRGGVVGEGVLSRAAARASEVLRYSGSEKVHDIKSEESSN